MSFFKTIKDLLNLWIISGFTGEFDGTSPFDLPAIYLSIKSFLCHPEIASNRIARCPISA